MRDVSHSAGGIPERRVSYIGDLQRLGARRDRYHGEAGDLRVAIEQFLIAKHVDQIDAIARWIILDVAVRVGRQTTLVFQGMGDVLRPFAVLHASLGSGAA